MVPGNYSLLLRDIGLAMFIKIPFWHFSKLINYLKIGNVHKIVCIFRIIQGRQMGIEEKHGPS